MVTKWFTRSSALAESASTEFIEAVFESGFELGRLTGLCLGFLVGAGFAGFLCAMICR